MITIKTFLFNLQSFFFFFGRTQYFNKNCPHPTNLEETSRGGGRGPRNSSPVSEVSPGGGGEKGGACSEGSLSSCPPGGSRPSSKLARYFGYDASEGHRHAGTILKPVQRTLGQFVFHPRPPAPFLHTRRVLPALLPAAAVCVQPLADHRTMWLASPALSIFRFSI